MTKRLTIEVELPSASAVGVYQALGQVTYAILDGRTEGDVCDDNKTVIGNFQLTDADD